jgi:hypothetical protein
MRRISSLLTFWYKRIFPVLWLGMAAVFVASVLISGHLESESLLFLIIPILIAAFGYFLMRKRTFDLVDEVLDTGDALLVRNSDREERVAFSDIVNVNYSHAMDPPRVTRLLRTPNSFGREITFCPPIRLVPFSKSPVVDELIAKIDAKRGR